MNLRRLAGIVLLGFGVAATGWAAPADDAVVANAAEQANGALVRTLIGGGADVTVPQVDGMTALHWAVYHDDAETAALLVRAGADVSAKNRYGVPPLSVAATNGNAETVTLLLDAGAEPNMTLRGGETVLMTAARTGNLGVVRALLAKGADPNATERRDQTALMWAAAEGHASIVHALAEVGADIHARLRSGFTPMFFGVREGHIDVVHTLLEAGNDVNEVLQRVKDGPDRVVNNASYRPVDDGITPLIMAVRNGHFELAVALINVGADPNDQRSGFTPLHTMSWVRKPDESDRGDPAPIGSGNLSALDFVRTLVELGADVNLRLQEGAPRQPNSASRTNSPGATPFLLAADRADAALMQLLFDLGADPMIPNNDGTTPLMAAAGLGTAAPEEEAGTEPEALIVTQFMLDLGADVNAVNGDGDTAMHGAAYGSFPTVVQLLADHGADIRIWNTRNKQDRTPLFIAEGHRPGLPRPSRATIAAITALMDGAGVSTEGERPEIVDQYSRQPEPPKPAETKPQTQGQTQGR
jgi:ankyrin repeat protein